MSRTRLKITILALALGGRVAAQEVHGWRTPSGELYFGAAPVSLRNALQCRNAS